MSTPKKPGDRHLAALNAAQTHFTEWFRQNGNENFVVRLTKKEHREGIRNIPAAYAGMVQRVAVLVKESHGYALTTLQSKVAFFAAARKCGRLLIWGRGSSSNPKGDTLPSKQRR